MMAVVRVSFACLAAGLFACVDTTPTGILGGQCKPDGTCNVGLACEVVEGSPKCVDPDAAPPSDGGADAPAGPRTCPLKPTVYPCGGQNPPFACYGATQSCSLTGCSGQTDIQWQCFSPNQCSSPCCVTAADAVLSGTSDCSQGTLLMQAVDGGGGVSGATCSQGAQCPSGATQLCQANSQCPTGQICSPVQVKNGGLSMNGAVVGACVPE
jgi:hypothetical protein